MSFYILNGIFIMNSYYDQCVDIAASILNALRKKYPKMWLAFFDKNLLRYLSMDEKMFNPSRPKIISEKKYKELLDKLKKFDEKNFIKWLLTK